MELCMPTYSCCIQGIWGTYCTPSRRAGTTLWTNVPFNDRGYIQRTVNDYHAILVGNNEILEVEDTVRWHQEQVAALQLGGQHRSLSYGTRTGGLNLQVDRDNPQEEGCTSNIHVHALAEFSTCTYLPAV
jgi:hypothetical protein